MCKNENDKKIGGRKHGVHIQAVTVDTSYITLPEVTVEYPPPPRVSFLPQTMLASDIQSLMNDVFHLISRVSIEALWPVHQPSDAPVGSTTRPRPKTYGEAYRTLLEDRDLLAMGIHRPPARRRGDTTSGRCPGGSRYVAINCPSAWFALRDGDCFFVLRRPGEAPKSGSKKDAPLDASASAGSDAVPSADAADGVAVAADEGTG